MTVPYRDVRAEGQRTQSYECQGPRCKSDLGMSARRQSLQLDIKDDESAALGTQRMVASDLDLARCDAPISWAISTSSFILDVHL